MKLLRVLSGVLLLLGFATAQAVHAGTTYVSLPGNTTVGGVSYETQITVTNSGGQQRTLNYLQLATEVDGTKRNGINPTPLAVAAGRTSVLKPAGNARGLLELSGPTGLQFSARMVRTGSNAGLGVELPVITSDNMGVANEELVVQGLQGSATRSTDLIFVNLGQAAASCTASVLRADGSLAFPTATFPLPALSHRHFSNVFAGVQGGVVDGRAEVTCTTDFYVYAQMIDNATGEFAIASPSGSSDSALTTPGEAPTCNNGAVCYVFPGLVHTSTNSNPDRSLVLTPPLAAYSSVKIRLDVQLGPWNRPNSAAHGVLYFVRNRNKDMYANIFLRGPGGNNVTLRHGFGQVHGDKAKIERGFAAQPGQTYTFDYEFNPVKKLIVLRVSQNGQTLLELTDRPNVNRVHIEQGDKVIIGLSNPGITSVEPASIGWKYSNIKVEFFP
jgi:hypothetical protein